MSAIMDISKSSNKVDDFDHGKVEEVKIKIIDGKIVLDYPMDNVDAADLPEVTILTVTRNRKKLFPLAIDNFKRTYYPQDKIKWFICDDSTTIDDGPIRELKALNDKRIQYYYLPPKQDDTPHSIGYKRNFALSMIKSDVIAIMDDDDYMYDNSIIGKVCALVIYGKQLVYSHEIGVYHIFNESSYILEDFKDVPEGSCLFTRKFWESQKYGDEYNKGEGINMLRGREHQCIKIPYFFNLIVLNHDTNTTGNARSVKFKLNRNSMVSGTLNFWKTTFPDSFKLLIKSL